MKTRKVGEANYEAAETGTKYVTWESDYVASEREKGAVHVLTTASGMVFTSKIQGIIGGDEPGVWADVTTAKSGIYYHQDTPMPRFMRAEIVMTTNPNGGDVEVWVLE